ncbi:MAG: hypothetical protein GWN00_20865, partial [Aliifodinibius sp.]|nr:hypothetical protein [candidate division Zixibacteria bacterium]NIT58588.1 hypothetical protein [Fodinibius sp.]NIV07185.1 hypothetical protein [candidate division Zixibacteria bacterium]NIY27171.1 hypothetical protein [Fodinibius sp.]
MSSNRVWSIYESAEQRGLLWIGTWGGGLNKLLRRKEEILHYKHKPGNPNSLGDNTVWSIYEDHSGALWIGTNKGLDKMERTEIGETGFTH